MSSIRLVLSVLLLAALALPSSAQQPSETMPVSGILKDPGGAPVAGPVDLTFRIHDAAMAGSLLWSEVHAGVTLDASGRYHVLLGTMTPLAAAVFATPERWLGIEVAADGEMTPRLALSSVASAREATQLAGRPGSEYALAAELSDQDPMTTPVHFRDLVGAPGGGGVAAITEFGRALLIDGTPQTVPMGKLWRVVSVLPVDAAVESRVPVTYSADVAGSTVALGHSGWGNAFQSSNTQAYAASMHGAPLPVSLPAGTTLAAAGGSGLLSVIEVDLQGGGATLALEGALLVDATPQTVPLGKVWEVTSLLPDTVAVMSRIPVEYLIVVDGSPYALGHAGWGNAFQSSNTQAYAAEMRATTLPVWLPAGTTVAAGAGTTFVAINVHDIVP